MLWLVGSGAMVEATVNTDLPLSQSLKELQDAADRIFDAIAKRVSRIEVATELTREGRKDLMNGVWCGKNLEAWLPRE